MKRFVATIEIPVVIYVEADDIKEAERIADEQFADVYDACLSELEDRQAMGKLPRGIAFGARYDDTEITEDPE